MVPSVILKSQHRTSSLKGVFKRLIDVNLQFAIALSKIGSQKKMDNLKAKKQIDIAYPFPCQKANRYSLSLPLWSSTSTLVSCRYPDKSPLSFFVNSGSTIVQLLGQQFPPRVIVQGCPSTSTSKVEAARVEATENAGNWVTAACS